MKNNATKITLGILTIIIVTALAYWANMQYNQPSSAGAGTSVTNEKYVKLSEEEGEEVEDERRDKKEREEYFFNLLRDPATNSIPQNIRARELNHSKQMPTLLEVNRRYKAKNPSVQVAEGFDWQLAGPPAVGGRTRALGIDQRNSDIIIAGGVSGGIWKSTDGGNTWSLRTPDFDNFSVTSLAQDPTNPDTWYYSSGEFLGSSESGRGRSASYYGSGIFKSTDNGNTWTRIPSTADDNTRFDSQFDYVSRIMVSPTTGTVFIASNGLGIFRSPNGVNFDDLTLGGFGEHRYADVTVASDGTLIGVLSSDDAGATGGDPGIFVSNDDGQSWTEITPSDFPAQYFRSVVAAAPSDPDIVYVFTSSVQANDLASEEHTFFKINLATGVSENRSANLPNFGGPVGYTATQNGYDMDIIVKPDDPNFVIIGGIDLFRSTDGFATSPNGDTDAQKDAFWIGGYGKANNVSQYPNHHPDQHINVFDPNNPNRLWSGQDGGVSVTDDVTAADVSWTDRNEGYVVTQFYDASIPPDASDNRLMGGTQDNGTPFFSFNNQQQTIGSPSNDISSGDGAFSFFTENFIFVSTPNGLIRRCPQNTPNVCRTGGNGFSYVHPSAASDQLFIHPYTIDPNDDAIMYYPGGNQLFRNTQIDQLSSGNSSGTTQGWEELPSAQISSGFNITALATTTLGPSNTLYYAGSGTGAPIIKRLDDASSSNEAPADISIPNAPSGTFVHDIAINPANGNDVLVVMSNYNIVGLYHTLDGGNSWDAVEGNLTGVNDDTSPNPGPSIRSATVVSSSSGPIYLLGTSTGLYATQNLDGDNTQWGQEAINEIGFSVIENITSRLSNGDVAVGSHGRGMFLGDFQGTIEIPDTPRISLNPAEGRAGDEITITATNFQFSSTASENVVTFGGLQADVIDASSSQITVVVPRNTLAPTAEDRNVLVKVTNPGGTDPGPLSFMILPPNQNDLSQNYPNPFSVGQGTTIPISLQNNSTVTINIYDTSGRRIDQPLKDDQYQAGTYNVPVNNFGNFASGIYIYQIIAKPAGGSGDTFVDSKKFTFIR